MAAIKVSEAEFKRLEALLKMEETGQRKKTGADVAGEALSFGKKIVVGYLIAGAVLFLICMVIVLPWMIRGFSQLDAQNNQVRNQVMQSMQQQMRPMNPVLDCTDWNHVKILVPLDANKTYSDPIVDDAAHGRLVVTYQNCEDVMAHLAPFATQATPN